MELDTSFDYLTITFRCPIEWEQTVDKILRLFPIAGHKRPWRFVSYIGYTYTDGDGHLAWGKGREGGVIQAGGNVCNSLVRLQDTWALPSFKVTRLDLACTFNLEGPAQLVRQLLEHQRQDWRAVLPTTEKGGGTLYVGSRVSDRFGRLYDKGALLNKSLPDDKQLPIAQLWRAEVEYKASAARGAWLDARKATSYDKRRQWIAETVLAWFQDHGVFLPIMSTSRSIVSVSSRAIDDVRTIKWFHEQVRPALLRLVDTGKGDEAFSALGLNPVDVVPAGFQFVGDGPAQYTFFDNEEQIV